MSDYRDEERVDGQELKEPEETGSDDRLSIHVRTLVERSEPEQQEGSYEIHED